MANYLIAFDLPALAHRLSCCRHIVFTALQGMMACPPLHQRCGNSDMSEQMYLDGYEDIFNIDISEKALPAHVSHVGRKRVACGPARVSVVAD
eukprot:4823500-Amphidinium_carterae.1